jgi:poly-gamma-glutamate synthesis protein (capsule biosynthesis protein)
VGDILVHRGLYEAAISSSERFRTIWRPLIPLLKEADFATANLEAPTAPGVAQGGRAVRDPGFVYDEQVYSGGNFVFNYHPIIIEDLKLSGVDLVTTANNHTLDRGALGVDRTVQELQNRGLDFVGTRARGSNEARSRVVRVKDRRLGVIACTEMTNGMRDSSNQVLMCNSREVVDEILRLKVQTDAVLVFPHWGDEYQPRPNQKQKQWARSWVEAGARAIIGSHPHVLQTTEWLASPDGRPALVIYSLGNFVALQGMMEKRVAAMAHIDLVPTASGLEIAQYSYTPFVRRSGSVVMTVLPDSAKGSENDHAKKQMGQIRCKP